MKDHIEMKKVTLSKVDDDTLMTRYKPEATISESDAQEIDNAHLTMSQGSDVFIIADFSADKVKIEKAAEEYFINKGKMIPFTKGIAIISSQKRSFFDKLFSRTRKTLYPVKEFDSVERAMSWIETLK